jgi:hypothetical protein
MEDSPPLLPQVAAVHHGKTKNETRCQISQTGELAGGIDGT